MFDSRPYLGIPWKKLGSDFSGADCWGLYCLVAERELGIDLPRNDELRLKALEEGLVEESMFSSLGFIVDKPQFGDCLHMWGFYEHNGVTKRIPIHCGFVVRWPLVLHVESINGGSHIINCERNPNKWRPIKCYRPLQHDRA